MKTEEHAFGQALRAARTRSGLSQEELSDKADIHWSYVSQLERGIKGPSLKVVLRLAQALGISAHSLVKDVEERIGGRARDKRPENP